MYFCSLNVECGHAHLHTSSTEVVSLDHHEVQSWLQAFQSLDKLCMKKVKLKHGRHCDGLHVKPEESHVEPVTSQVQEWLASDLRIESAK